MSNAQKLYQLRFVGTGLAKRQRVWRVLCHNFFDSLVRRDSTVLDLACGYGEFINAVRCGRKLAVDANPDARTHLAEGIEFYCSPATDLGEIPNSSVDVVFSSNFLEHLSSKAECAKVFVEVWRVLKPGGDFIVLGPNIRYAYREYWNYFDHNLPLSDLSLSEGLRMAGFTVSRVIPRFLPFSMNNSRPTPDIAIRLYLRFSVAWRLFGKQFLVIARKQNMADDEAEP